MEFLQPQNTPLCEIPQVQGDVRDQVYVDDIDIHNQVFWIKDSTWNLMNLHTNKLQPSLDIKWNLKMLGTLRPLTALMYLIYIINAHN